MLSLSSPHSSQARHNYLFNRLSQAVILALFIFGVTATSSGEGEPTTTSLAESSQTLGQSFSEGHSIPSSVATAPIETTTTIVDGHSAQEYLDIAVSSTGDPAEIIEVDGDSCPDGYEELVDEEGTIPEKEEMTVVEANGEATGTGASGVEQAIIEKNATNHPPVMGDVPIDPLDHSFIETVQEVVAESSAPEDKEILDDFLAELFQELEGEPPTESVQTPLTQNPTPPTEEEIAERKRRLAIETREKRIEITGRHAQWEVRLEERGKEVQAELLKQVNELRARVSDDVGNNEEIAKLLSGYENEANKAIKGVEVFFEKRIKIGKKVEESVVRTWEDVLKKVQKKFEDKKREVDEEMQEYYESYIDEELKHIEAAIKRVEGFADEAQADLGLDYAWLDDVTVNDWTRYHDLARTAKRWGGIYRTVFNSTHPELSINTVVFALENFQATVQDIGVGFDHVLGDLERKAEQFIKGEYNIEEVPGLGEEGVVTPQGEAAEQATQKGEEVPILGLGGEPASAAPVAHRGEL